ncbi:hypothetical protein HDU89_001134 [Geranomyces variabilis]|nr:hypothetical protein HDU89_001134 [Geranomyces variabilis]
MPTDLVTDNDNPSVGRGQTPDNQNDNDEQDDILPVTGDDIAASLSAGHDLFRCTETTCFIAKIEKTLMAAMQTIVLNTPLPAKSEQLVHVVLPVEIEPGRSGVSGLSPAADRSLRVGLNDRARTRALLDAVIDAEEKEYQQTYGDARARAARNNEPCRPPQREKLPIQRKFSLRGGLLCSQLAWSFRLWYDQYSLWAGNEDTKLNVFELLDLLTACVELG